MKNGLNIKSSTIEKSLDLAKEFLGKLVSPSFEEMGLYFADNIKYIRFKQQVKILLKAKKYVEEKNINLKEIPIKILVPLLENASLEEEEELQDKWSIMLTNMADSESNLQNKIFPYILSQLSIEEFDALKNLDIEEKDYRQLFEQYIKLKSTNDKDIEQARALTYLKEKIKEIMQSGFLVLINDFELSNLQRLGLVRELPPKILINEFQTGSNYDSFEEWHSLEAEYDISSIGHRITELGEKFIEICELNTEKQL